jgi:2-dehydro-3-deoxyphosphogluconate aldolase/(4S)-4-hydroxy-2-oxoglutarate aldolase
MASFLDYRILPVLVIRDASISSDLAEALIDSGLPLVEVTLRTDESWSAVEKLTKSQKLIVGIGSVSQESELKRAQDLGLKFAVSPGFSPELFSTAKQLEIEYLPGVATPSEILNASRMGARNLKWFPAKALGGVSSLRAASAPFPNLNFIPTGGLDLAGATEFLKEPNVKQVGGSWMLKEEWLANRDFAAIRASITESLSILSSEK